MIDDAAIHEIIGEWLRSRRVKLGYTQTQLGEATDCTYQQVQKYERGKNRLSLGKFFLMCDALGADPVEAVQEVLDRRDGSLTVAVPGRKRLELMKILDRVPDEKVDYVASLLRGLVRGFEPYESGQL